MKVINTRPSPDAAPFTAAIRARGATSIWSPVMAIRLHDKAASIEPGEALAFTSANGVRAFERASAERDFEVFAVGEATARAARHAGFGAVEVADGDVDSLANLIAKTKASPRILHLAGADRAGDLVGALQARGVEARRLVLYDAAPIADLSDEARGALVTEPHHCAVGLFSARSARVFMAQITRAGVEDALSNALLLALSPAVAAAAAPACWRRVLVAPARTLDSLADLIGG